MYFDYLNVLVFASVGFVFVFANVLIGSLIRPQRKDDAGLETYECGELTIGDSWIQFDIRYYTVALIYVIFAVEIAFLFPWAMVLKEAFVTPGIGGYAVIKGVIFVVILFLGLASVWSKGDLDWVMSYGGKAYTPTARREDRAIPHVSELLERGVETQSPELAGVEAPEPAEPAKKEEGEAA
jgi:NADH-quinone oxidoreductase subunit A